MSENSSESRINYRRITLKILLASLVAGTVWFLRPMLHAIIYRAFYSPGGALLVLLPVSIGVLLYFLPPIGEESTESIVYKSKVFGGVLVLGLVLSIVFGLAGGVYEEKELANEAMDRAEVIDDFPEFNEDNPRIVPRAVADTQTRGSVSYAQHQLGKSDIARSEDGDLVWSYPIQPDQFQNQLSGNQRGVLLSDMTRMEDREISAYDNQTFKYGQNMFLHRSAEWNIKKSGGFWSQYRDDPIEFVHNGTAYMAFLKTGHEWDLFPVPHTTPTWDGVALVHPDGTVDHLSPEEAQESEILDGQRIFPLYNSERYAQSLEYRNGFWNQVPILGTFSEVVNPASLPSGSDNSQPFVVDLEGERMSYIHAMEPAGQQTRGLAEVWFFDSQTGNMRYYSTGDSTLLGPERATDIVRSEDTQTTWDTPDSNGQFSVVEPIPIAIDGELWWHSKVVPVDNTDVTRNSFVSAETGNVMEFETTENVVQFMSGAEIEGINDSDENMNDSETENITGYVLVKDEDGNVVQRIPIREGENIEIDTTADDSDNDE